ncbi:MAG: helix-hairpin-helix domain-containing protein [Pyrinomonadaceae bacterium]|nr:helix-hairpin-helix domain-containing protein [Pyrinomonadaceae bacterium]
MAVRTVASLILLALSITLISACGQVRNQPPQIPGTNSSSGNSALNINTATIEELQKIPHIGEKLAAKIVNYREANGAFRKVEHLMLIPGISDKRFRTIKPFVRVE